MKPATHVCREIRRRRLPAEVRVRYLDEKTVHLVQIMAKTKGLGHGTVTLKILCDIADSHGVQIVAFCEPNNGSPRNTMSRLLAWYQRHSFAVLKPALPIRGGERVNIRR
jgi:hypothetical protein